MKSLFLLTLFALPLAAQAPLAAPSTASKTPPETVIATIEGRPLTFGELNSYISTLPQAQAQAAMADIDGAVKQYALLLRLAKLGEERKYDQLTPYNDILRAGRMQVLAQAMVSEQFKRTLVLPDEQEQYYKDHLSQYSKLKVKSIYISFASDPNTVAPDGKKYRSEAEASKFAADLVKKLRAGADFVAMVKQYSDDQQSKESNGDWGTVSASDNLPEDFKNAVLALKLGEVADPIRRSGGFYIMKADSRVERPYSEVRDEIYNTIQNVRMRDWMNNLQNSLGIKIEPGAAKATTPGTPPA